MRDKIEFQPNKPEIIRLDWDEGTLKPGRYGDEFMYVCDSDARIMFVKPELHSLIKQTGAKAGEEIAITKREIKEGRSKRVQWEVERIEEEPHPAPAASAAPAPAPPPAPETKPASPAPAPSQIATALTFTNPLTNALTAAIDAAAAAERFAQTKNFALRFNSEDIRAMALSLYIQATRNGGPR